jgi:hypothetical protein
LLHELPQAKVAGGAIEFGTVPVTQIFMAVFIDHWLLHEGADKEDAQYWRAQLRILLAPREKSWERSVLKHADVLYDQTLRGLAAWDRG